MIFAESVVIDLPIAGRPCTVRMYAILIPIFDTLPLPAPKQASPLASVPSFDVSLGSAQRPGSRFLSLSIHQSSAETRPPKRSRDSRLKWLANLFSTRYFESCYPSSRS